MLLVPNNEVQLKVEISKNEQNYIFEDIQLIVSVWC